MRSRAATTFLLVAGAALSACGGGSSGSSPAPAAPAPAASSDPATASGSPASSDSSPTPQPMPPPSPPQSGAAITVSTSPARAGLVVGQKIALEATTNDSAGVTWGITPSGGSIAPATSLSGAAVTLTAPAAAGVYTVKATSVTDATQSSSVTLGVTNLAGVYTFHNDLARDGANVSEYALTTANVNKSTFGKLFSCAVDGAIYAQPLWVANLTINGQPHNVVFVATAHDSLYAFDADASPCALLWKVSLIDTAHGGTGGESAVPSGPTGHLVGKGDGDMSPEAGITGTPVIDPSRALYVVSKSMNTGGTQFYQRLHAINLATGAEQTGSPVTVAASYAGSGDGGTTVSFNAQTENQRAGLALLNGTVYVSWGSHEDAGHFFGWLIGYTYDGSRFTRSYVFNAGPNTAGAGIWMGGTAPAADSANTLYAVTGNGGFDAGGASSPNNDYGDSLLKLTPGLAVQQYFTPSNQLSDDQNNNDFGAGGAAVLADLPASSPVSHLVLAGGKDGNLYVLNRDALGGLGDGNAWQTFTIGIEGSLAADTPGVIFSPGAFWNNYFYIAGVRTPMVFFRLDPSTARFSPAGHVAMPSGGFGYPGSTPSVSAQGTTNGIVWVLDNGSYCTKASTSCGPAVLHAYDATNLATEFWNSSMVTADAAGNAVKFVVPTIANGKVYVGTRGNNIGGVYGSTSISGELDVYGLKSN